MALHPERWRAFQFTHPFATCLPGSRKGQIERKQQMQFNRNEIIIPHSSRYPDGALVVDGYDDNGRLLAHPVGGGLQFVIGTDKQAQLRRVPADEQKNPCVRRAQL